MTINQQAAMVVGVAGVLAIFGTVFIIPAGVYAIAGLLGGMIA